MILERLRRLSLEALLAWEFGSLIVGAAVAGRLEAATLWIHRQLAKDMSSPMYFRGAGG